MCRKLGRSFPVGLGTSSRILRGSPAVFVLSRNFAVTYAFFGYFWVNLPDFQHFWVDFGHFWANFEHFLTAFISKVFGKRIRFPVGLELFAGLHLPMYITIPELSILVDSW